MPNALQFEPLKPEIRIFVNRRTHDITVAPTVVHLKANQEVKWRVFAVKGDGDFEEVAEAGYLITFRDVKAVGTNEVRGGGQGPALGETQPPPPKTRSPGRYHYKVMVAIRDVIYADVGCPSMVVD